LVHARSYASWNEVSSSGIGGAVGYLNAARQVRQDSARHILLGQRISRGARVHEFVVLKAVLVIEYRAIFDNARVGRAGSDGAREYVAVPAVHKVGVQSEASRVTVGENETSTVVQRVEWRHAEVHFVEDRDKVNRMRRRALAVIEYSRVSQVRLVVRRVEVATIPATREEHLGPEAVWAVGIGESWGL
jgi:hypothetical protein